MKRKILLPSILLAASAIGLGAGTYANWTDTASSGSSTVTAGSMYASVSGGTFNVTSNPGQCNTTTVTVTNNGTAKAIVKWKFVLDADNENSIVPPETALSDTAPNGELSPWLDINFDGTGATPLSTLNGTAPQQDTHGEIQATESRTYSVQECVNNNAPNYTMTDSSVFHIEFTLEQVI